MTRIRKAVEQDAATLPEIEKSSGSIFRQWKGLEWIADDAVQSSDEHRRLIRHGLAWVAEEDDRGIVAFLNGELLPDALHIWQIAVHRQRQGRGIGRALIETARLFALENGVEVLTLTTFREVPWNEAYYQRLGFLTLSDAATPHRLQQLLQDEANAGLPLKQRCAMLMPVSSKR